MSQILVEFKSEDIQRGGVYGQQPRRHPHTSNPAAVEKRAKLPTPRLQTLVEKVKAGNIWDRRMK